MRASKPMLLQKIITELQDVPEPELNELYQFIQRLPCKNSSIAKYQNRQPGLLTGKLSDSFFEPLPEDELQLWE
jgi:hypothetical protein